MLFLFSPVGFLHLKFVFLCSHWKVVCVCSVLLIESLHKFVRVKTRAITVDFNLPTVEPNTEEEEEEFEELDNLLASGSVSSAIGWAVRAGAKLEMRKDELKAFAYKSKTFFTGRSCKNWRMLIFFLNEVSVFVIVVTTCMYVYLISLLHDNTSLVIEGSWTRH